MTERARRARWTAVAVFALALALFLVPVRHEGRRCGLALTSFVENRNVDGAASACVQPAGKRLLATLFVGIAASAVAGLARRLDDPEPAGRMRAVLRGGGLIVGVVAAFGVLYVAVPAGRTDPVFRDATMTSVTRQQDCGPAIVHGWMLRPLDSPRTCAGIAGARLTRSLLAIVAAVSLVSLVGLAQLTYDRARLAVVAGWAAVLVGGLVWSSGGGTVFAFGHVWNGDGSGDSDLAGARTAVLAGVVLTLAGVVAGLVAARRDERERVDDRRRHAAGPAAEH